MIVAAGTSMPTRDTQMLSFPAIPIEFIFRSLQPGEVILAVLKDKPPVNRVILRFLDRRYVLDNAAPGKKPFAFIGIDLGVKAQPYIMYIVEEKPDGRAKIFRQELTIKPKEFPKQTFQVEEAMVIPPASVLPRIQREQKLVQEVYSRITPEWLGTGNFIPPLDEEASLNFGQQRIYNQKVASTHTGVDIAAPLGEPARASNSGKVVLAGHLYLSGKTVIIDHGLGVFTVYGHFSEILVKQGDLVKKGDFIGKVGDTGRSIGTHLHWGVRIFNSRVDPFSLVSLPLE
jgi:murein DD-endopeptidase MepM/ murein hydrolase activator NlpD